MPPKFASTAAPPRWNYPTTARKPFPNHNSASPNFRPPSSTAAAIRPPSTAFSTSYEFSQNTIQNPLHATTPAFHTQPQSSMRPDFIPLHSSTPPRRNYPATGRKPIPNHNSSTPNYRPPSYTVVSSAAVVAPPSAAIPASSQPYQNTRPVHRERLGLHSSMQPHWNYPTTGRNSTPNRDSATANSRPPSSTTDSTAAVIGPPSTVIPSSSEFSQNTSPIHTTYGINDSENEESEKSFDPENSGIEHSWPEIRKHVHNEGSVKPVTGPESAASGVAGPGNVKRKIVKKTVRVVKKIKKRVPKRVLMNGSQNQGLVLNTEHSVNLSEVTKGSNFLNDVIEKSNVVDEVIEKNSIANEANGMMNVPDDVTKKSNVVENTNMSKEAIQKLKLVNNASVLEPFNREKGNDRSDIYSVETEISKLNFGAYFPEQMVLANDQSGIHNMDTEYINSDVITEVYRNDSNVCFPDYIEVENVNYDIEPFMETKVMTNTMAEHQLKGSFVGNQNLDDIVNKVDVGLFADRNVGPVGEKNVVLVREENKCITEKPESGSGVVESGHIRLNEGLLFSGEMEALERKKRRKTEIFVGGLDKDTKEDDIRKGFEEAGVIVEVTLVMNVKTGKNKGYAFVRFATAADAKNALEKFSKVEICGKLCDAAPVEGNDTIFLGNIDRNWKTEDVVTLLEKADIRKIDKVTLKANPNNIEKNRGFAFVEFETRKDAQIAFSKLQKKDAFGKNPMVKVAWAQPLIEPDEEEMLKVKSIYAEYLPSSWDEEKVKEYFKRFGDIENVVLAKDLPSSRRKDFAFINYITRDAALACIEAVSREGLEDDHTKVKMTVSLAKPISKRKKKKHTPDLPIKQLSKPTQKASQTPIKHHEPQNKGKPASSSPGQVKVDNRLSTTDELVQILRQQASSEHIPPHPMGPQASSQNIPPDPRTGTYAPGHHFPLPGSKRPFSLVGHDPLEPQRLSLVRMESSHPISGPSSSFHGVGPLSFPHHRHPGPGFASESANERRVHPSHFKARANASFCRDNNKRSKY